MASSRKINWTSKMDNRLIDWATNYSPPVSVAKQAKALGLGVATVSGRRKFLGIKSDRTQARAANEAKKVDAATRRATIVDSLTDHLGTTMKARTATQHMTLIRVEGTEMPTTLDFIPLRDQVDQSRIMSTDAGTLERLHRMDADTGVQDATSMLGGIAALLSGAAAEMPEDGPEGK